MPQPPFPIPAAEIASIQADFTSVMEQSVKIERPTNSRGTWAETLESWTTLSAATPCLLDEPTGGELEKYVELIGDKVAWKLLLPAGTNVQRNDRLTVASSGDVLRVQGVDSPKSYEIVRTVIATEVR